MLQRQIGLAVTTNNDTITTLTTPTYEIITLTTRSRKKKAMLQRQISLAVTTNNDTITTLTNNIITLTIQSHEKKAM